MVPLSKETMVPLSGETTAIPLVVDLDRALSKIEPFARIHLCTSRPRYLSIGKIVRAL
jgi:hypothetical protein